MVRLAAGDRSRRMALLRALLDMAAVEPDARGPLGDVEAMWEALVGIQAQAPSEFDEIFMLPQTGMWIAHTLRRLHAPSAEAVPLWADVGYVFNVALAVAIHAGIEMAAEVPCRDGNVMFPALGMACLGGAGVSFARAHVDKARLRLTGAHGTWEAGLPVTGDVVGWWPLRQLECREPGYGLKVWLDDIDPYREMAEPVPPERIPDADVRRWRELFTGSCAVLARSDPAILPALAVGLKSIVPLPSAANDAILSASSGDSSGSALISRPSDPVGLALTLVHEFQHIKLGGVLHLLALCSDDPAANLYAPWRDDPRPLSGLLQGTYAFLGVTGFWHGHLNANAVPDVRLAAFEFALWREQTWRAVGTLRSHPGLTDLGRRFADGMANHMQPWWDDRVAPDVLDAVWLAANDHRTAWRIRHLHADSGYVAAVADAVRHGWLAELKDVPKPAVVPDNYASWTPQRRFLVRRRVLRAGGSLTEPGQKVTGPEITSGLRVADEALVFGDHRSACDEYTRLLATDPSNGSAWVGLLLALALQHKAARQLLRCPELVVAVHQELSVGPAAPDPREVACRLCGLG
ncbi:MAG TPA: HEXXH motif domain-containing protein [Trebonia sp.]|nr:HEXXH motif domain-containing protein [Trebonia sp.]